VQNIKFRFLFGHWLYTAVAGFWGQSNVLMPHLPNKQVSYTVLRVASRRPHSEPLQSSSHFHCVYVTTNLKWSHLFLGLARYVFPIVVIEPEQRSLYSDSLPAGRSGDWIPVGGRDFLHPSRPALGPTQPHTMGTGLFQGVKRPRSGVDHSSLLAPRLKKEYSYAFTPLLGHHGRL
jgi:hypothetical protein